MAAELTALAVLVVATAAELIHGRRVRRVKALAFGPRGCPALWVHLTPAIRVVSLALLSWGLITLTMISPRVYRAKSVDEGDIRHIVIVLDVSPSMKLADAGPELAEARWKRAYTLMQSFFKRVPMEQVRLSLVAVYTDAKPVVVDTKDVDVVRNFLDGLDMYYAFDSGQTELFDGLIEAARIAEDWKPRSTTIVLISDGDTVPASGMPKMPRSVDGVLVVGVGDPKTGKFIDGRLSRQDTSTLRQIALRLGGTFHDGNQNQLPSETILTLTEVQSEDPFEQLTRREYALIACGLGAAGLAFLPVLLQMFGTSWRPGVRTSRASS
jgi:Ca-activated chloride channel family protein